MECVKLLTPVGDSITDVKLLIKRDKYLGVQPEMIYTTCHANVRRNMIYAT